MPLRRARAAALLACLGVVSGAAVPPPVGDEAVDVDVDEHLAGMTVSLTDTRPYHFVLAYHGPPMPFRGRLCYHFAGYNETCTEPGLEWLTPATRIELHAPGGVPRDLLQGYLLLARFPALSERTFRYPLPGDG